MTKQELSVSTGRTQVTNKRINQDIGRILEERSPTWVIRNDYLEQPDRRVNLQTQVTDPRQVESTLLQMDLA